MRLTSTVNLALPMLIGGFVQFVISQFYQKFATDTLLLDSAIVGGIFFVSRATDAVLDPVCGYLSDKTGRRRLFIGLGLLTLVAGSLLAFFPALGAKPGEVQAQNYIFAAAGIFTIYLGVTLVYIPHYAWLAEYQKQHPNLPFFASRAVVENLGTILGGIALAVIVPLQQKGASLLTAILAMTAVLALAGVTPLMAYRETGRNALSHDYSFVRSLKTLGTNRRFALIALMSFCNQFAATTLLAVSLYYTDYVLGNKELGVTLAVVFLLSATLFVPVWATLSKRIDRFRIWRLALIGIILVFPTMLITQAGHLWYLSVFAVLVGGLAGAVILFVPQEVSFVTHEPASDEGMYFAAFTFVNKSAMACAPLVIGLGLSFAGYSPTERTPAAANMITVLFIALPAAAFLLSAIGLQYYIKLRSAAPRQS